MVKVPDFVGTLALPHQTSQILPPGEYKSLISILSSPNHKKDFHNAVESYWLNSLRTTTGMK